MEYEIFSHDGFVEVVTHGDADAATFRQFLDEMFGQEDWEPGTPVLHDHSDLNAAPLTVNDVSAIAHFCADSRADFGTSHLAVVVARDLEFGLARMWEAFVDGKWDVTAQVFRTRDDAVSWLEEPPR
jgi:hypothetical protein